MIDHSTNQRANFNELKLKIHRYCREFLCLSCNNVESKSAGDDDRLDIIGLTHPSFRDVYYVVYTYFKNDEQSDGWTIFHVVKIVDGEVCVKLEWFDKPIYTVRSESPFQKRITPLAYHDYILKEIRDNAERLVFENSNPDLPQPSMGIFK